MHGTFAEKLASALISENAHLGCFNVDVLDADLCQQLMDVLQSRGYKVERADKGTSICVVCDDREGSGARECA
jgi:hypothetical protein